MAVIDYPHEVHKLLGKKKVSISCVIPAFNEGPRIGKVLDVVVDFPIFNEIVLVNDGSTDETLEVMREYKKKYPKLKVVDIKKNVGKSDAVEKGVAKASSEMVFLVDADLTGLKYEHLYKMAYYLLTHEFDMTILDREGDRVSPLGWASSWTNRLDGGERNFWLRDFSKIKFEKGAKYTIEQIINLYYVNNGLKVRTIWCPGLYGALQIKKKGFLKGLDVYRKMFIDIYKHSKVKGFYIQIENIVEDRIEPLYKLRERTKHKRTAMGVIVAAGLLSSIAAFVYLNLKRLAIRKS